MSLSRQYIFSTLCREDLIHLSHKGTLCLKKRLSQKHSKQPIIITVDGSMDGGKSLVWDSIIEKLLGDTAKKIYELPSHDARKMETWKGENQIGEKRKLTVTVCNPDQLPDKHNKFVEFLEKYLSYESPQNAAQIDWLEYGDVIIISNRSCKISDLHFDIRKNHSDLKTKWSRAIKISAGAKISKSKEFKTQIIRESEYSIAPYDY